MFKKGNFMNSTGLFFLSGHDAATWAPLIFYSKPFQMNWNVGSCRHFLSVLSSVSIPEFMLLISNPSSCTQAKHNGPTLITWTALTGSMSSMYGWKTNLYNTPASLLLHPYLSLHVGLSVCYDRLLVEKKSPWTFLPYRLTKWALATCVPNRFT